MPNRSGKSARNRILFAGFLAGTSVAGAEYLALSPWGSYSFFLWTAVAVLAVLVALVAVLVVLLKFALAVYRKRERTYWLNVLVASVAFVFLLAGGIKAGGAARELQFMALANRSEALISAIEAYTFEVGSPPPDLSALVPEYLAEVPTTGMGAYPEYAYHTPGAANNPWSIVVHTPYGIVYFDQFWYLPNGNYEDNDIGFPKRIGHWAYIYE